MIVDGYVHKRRSRYVRDSKVDGADLFRNTRLGHHALTDRVRRTRSRAAVIPGAAHRGTGEPAVVAVVSGDRHEGCPRVLGIHAGSIQVTNVHRLIDRYTPGIGSGRAPVV